jgi:riboflavin kinase/FMN adenylyltransferase
MAPAVITDYHAFPEALRGGVLCVGNFDGVHAGHARMLATGKSCAQERHAPFTIMTFDPHPAAILRPEAPRVPLTTGEQRRELLAAFDPDVLLIIPTTREFLAIAPDEFLGKIVHERLQVRLMVEGPSFTYGRGAKGTVQTLQQGGPALGIESLIVPTEQVTLSDLTLVNVSSSLTRWLVEKGRVKDVGQCLNRPYALRGEVVHGAQRGNGLGFPTANLAPRQLLPAPGIYAGIARLTDGRRFKAAISIGDNPTFHGAATTVEAHLLDFSEDLYGQAIEIEFHLWLREMLPFAGAGPLVAQMHKDVAQTRERIAL